MRARITPWLERLSEAGTANAVWLAGAMIINNAIALVISVAFSHMLSNYGAFAALVSYLTILTVFGQAVQVATARDGVLGRLGEGEQLLNTLASWSRALAVFTVFATIVSILLRAPIADLVGVKHEQWAAAAGIPAGCTYLAVCTLRGALQGIGDYKSVGISLIGEQTTRLIAGVLLAEVGLGIGGAYVGSLVAYVAMSAYCAQRLYAQLAGRSWRWHWRAHASAAISFGRHVWVSAVPIAALGIVQLLQNMDLIMAKHRFSNGVASAYSVDAIAAKVLIWVAMGASFYLVPEVSRRHVAGQDPRPVLGMSVGMIAICAVPCLLIFAVAGHPLISIVFGSRRAIAIGALLPLGAAFTILSVTYLAVQYMLALKRVWFLLALAVVAALEPLLLLQASRHPDSFAALVLVIQLLGAAVAFGLALTGRTARVAVEAA